MFKYPFMEIVSSSTDTDLLQDLFSQVRDYKICWMAFEILDEFYRTKRYQSMVKLSMRENSIMIHSRTNRLMAQILFEQEVVVAPKPYRWIK